MSGRGGERGDREKKRSVPPTPLAFFSGTLSLAPATRKGREGEESSEGGEKKKKKRKGENRPEASNAFTSMCLLLKSATVGCRLQKGKEGGGRKKARPFREEGKKKKREGRGGGGSEAGCRWSS